MPTRVLTTAVVLALPMMVVVLVLMSLTAVLLLLLLFLATGCLVLQGQCSSSSSSSRACMSSCSDKVLQHTNHHLQLLHTMHAEFPPQEMPRDPEPAAQQPYKHAMSRMVKAS
jgi:hypothetical protein